MSSVAEGMPEPVSGDQVNKLEKEVPAYLKADNEVGDASKDDGDLMLSKNPYEIEVEGKEDVGLKSQHGEKGEGAATDSSEESAAIVDKETKFVSDDSQPKENRAADGIHQPTTEDDSKAENSVEGEVRTSPGQEDSANDNPSRGGILSLFGLGSSKPAVADDELVESQPSADESNQEKEHKGILQSLFGKESKSSNSPHESKGAEADYHEPLDVKSGESTDTHGRSVAAHASESPVSFHGAKSNNVSALVHEQTAANDSKSHNPSDSVEVGEVADRPHETDISGNSLPDSADENATTASETPEKEETSAPAGKPGLLELVGGGVLSLIGLGGAKHAAESPLDAADDEETRQPSSIVNEADTDISKTNAPVELVDDPRSVDVTRKDSLQTVDGAKDGEAKAEELVRGQTPESNTNGSTLKTADDASGEVPSTPLSDSGYSDDENTRKESEGATLKPVDIQKGRHGATTVESNSGGNSLSVIDSKEAETAEKASEPDFNDLHTSLTHDREGTGKAANEIPKQISGNEKDYVTESARAVQPTLAAVQENGIQTDSDKTAADKINEQEAGVQRKAVSGDDGEPEVFKTTSQSPRTDGEDKKVRQFSDAGGAKQTQLPKSVGIAQEQHGEGLDSEGETPRDLHSNERTDPRSLASEQYESPGLETVQKVPAEEKTSIVADPNRVGEVESQTTQKPNLQGAKQLGTKGVNFNGHINDYPEWPGGDENRTDNLRQPAAFRNEVSPPAVIQQAVDVENGSEARNNLEDTSRDGNGASSASTLVDQQSHGVDVADSQSRSIFGITLKRLDSGNSTPAGEIDSHAKDKESPSSIGKGSDQSGTLQPLQTSNSGNVGETANPNTKDKGASLENGNAAHGDKFFPMSADECKEQDGETEMQQQLMENHPKDESKETPAMVAEEVSKESNEGPTPNLAVEERNGSQNLSTTSANNTSAQTDLPTKADTSNASDVSSEKTSAPPSKENLVEKQSGTNLSELEDQTDIGTRIPKQEDGIAFEDCPPTTPQSLNDSRSTTPPETPLTQRAEHLEQKHPPSPADDQSAPRSPATGALPLGIQKREWSTPGDQSKETTGSTNTSEYVSAKNAFEKPTAPENSATHPVEKGASDRPLTKPTVKRSKSKSGVAKLKVCFTGCSGAEN